MRLRFQVDATSKATIQLGLEIAHFFTQLTQFLFESSHLVVDFVDGGGEALLHLGER